MHVSPISPTRGTRSKADKWEVKAQIEDELPTFVGRKAAPVVEEEGAAPTC